MVLPHVTSRRYMGLCDCCIDNIMNFLQEYLDVTVFVLQDPHFDNDGDPSSDYVIPDRSDDYFVPPLPCDLQVGELAPSRRHVFTSPLVSNGPVDEGDNPYSNVARDEASCAG